MIDTQALRQKVLELAIRGKLTEQLPEDGTAEELYAKIQEEKQTLIKEGKIKKEKPLLPIAEDESPFEIPANWKWCRLVDVGSTNIGLTYGPHDIVDDGTIVVRSSNIINGKMDYTDLVKVNCHIRENQYLYNNDIVICARNGSKALVGKCAIFEGKSMSIAFGAFMAVFRTLIHKYAYYYFNSLQFRKNFAGDDSKQINQVTQNTLKVSLIPLPPLAEQKRIVEKIESIFSVLDKIDLLQSKYVNNLSALKTKIIEAGIQGKLTEQLPEDGTAEELFEKIQQEKQALIKEGKIKKEKPLPPITEDEIPFAVPENWKWVRLGSIGDWGAGATPSRANPMYYGGNIPWVKTGDLNDDYINTVPESITQLALDSTSVRINPVGSILIAMYGATIGKLGILNIPATTNQACCACIPIGIFNRYLFYLLMSHKRRFTEKAVGGAQPNISKEKIVTTLIPLPPLAEQKRIVAMLDAVLSILDSRQ